MGGNTIRLLSIWSIFTLRPFITKLFFTLIQLFFRTQLTHPKHCISWQLSFNAFVVNINKTFVFTSSCRYSVSWHKYSNFASRQTVVNNPLIETPHANRHNRYAIINPPFMNIFRSMFSCQEKQLQRSDLPFDHWKRVVRF